MTKHTTKPRTSANDATHPADVEGAKPGEGVGAAAKAGKRKRAAKADALRITRGERDSDTETGASADGETPTTVAVAPGVAAVLRLAGGTGRVLATPESKRAEVAAGLKGEQEKRDAFDAAMGAGATVPEAAMAAANPLTATEKKAASKRGPWSSPYTLQVAWDMTKRDGGDDAKAAAAMRATVESWPAEQRRAGIKRTLTHFNGPSVGTAFHDALKALHAAQVTVPGVRASGVRNADRTGSFSVFGDHDPKRRHLPRTQMALPTSFAAVGDRVRSTPVRVSPDGIIRGAFSPGEDVLVLRVERRQA